MGRLRRRRIRQLAHATIKHVFQHVLVFFGGQQVRALLGHRGSGELFAQQGKLGTRRILFRQLALKIVQHKHRILRRRGRRAPECLRQFSFGDKRPGAELVRSCCGDCSRLLAASQAG
ncbi:Unknown protein sequence [Pseudomonas syringae pv. maculicola]|nr:Unknown protein sequence [Pseudomonas syringae pv. maculicola]